MLESIETLNARQFVIAVKRLADSFSYGTDRSPFLGSGVEYVQTRPYLSGDSVRAIDWRVTARTGKFHVKEYEAPKRMPCYLLVDTSASMTISSLNRSKYAVAVFIAGGLAFACLDRISPVGVMGVGSRSIRVEPSLSKDNVMQWMHRLRRYHYDEPTAVGPRIAELCASLPNRALLVLLSDLHDESAIPALKLAAQQHDCVVLQMRDPTEVEMRGSGFVRAREAETGRTFVTHGRRQWIDPASVRNELKRGGIDQLLIDVDQPYAHRLRHFFKARGFLGRGAR